MQFNLDFLRRAPISIAVPTPTTHAVCPFWWLVRCPFVCIALVWKSFVFKSASSAQNMVLFVNFVTGLALMVTSFVLNLVESTRDVNAKLKWVYRLFPG